MPIRILTFMLFMLCFTFFSTAQDANELYEEATNAYTAKEFKKAGDLYAQSFELSDNKTAAFNAACSYSLANDKKKATKLATAAYEGGMFGFDTDADFDNVRSYKKFEKVASKARAELIKLNDAPALPSTYIATNYNKDIASPLIILLHGYGGSPEGMINAHKEIAEQFNAVLLAPRADIVSGRNSFHWSNSEDFYPRLRKEIDNAIRKYNIDSDQIILTGFSQGGWLTYDFGLKNADLIDHFLPVAGRVPNELTLAKNAKEDLKLFCFAGLKESQKFLDSYENVDAKLDEIGVQYYIKKLNIGHSYPPERTEALREAILWLLE